MNIIEKVKSRALVINHISKTITDFVCDIHRKQNEMIDTINLLIKDNERRELFKQVINSKIELHVINPQDDSVDSKEVYKGVNMLGPEAIIPNDVKDDTYTKIENLLCAHNLNDPRLISSESLRALILDLRDIVLRHNRYSAPMPGFGDMPDTLSKECNEKKQNDNGLICVNCKRYYDSSYRGVCNWCMTGSWLKQTSMYKGVKHGS